ncbi:hypothetical protein FLM48_20035 [Shewanella sp. Scap07]|uniref:hypothetical protein n=1 Tax=Shewanella sp. Scap07 TaxID=2589987 RepID=UPI0015BE967F|nr:hypothetical protein [Shewanella sp. Scap07]QLE87162.1 hypothetical protein FLM48_20035 [Shewanella sp. Scap07]
MKKTISMSTLIFSLLFSASSSAGHGHNDEFSLESDNTQTISFCAAASLQLPGKGNETNIFYSALKAITDNASASERQIGIVEGLGLGQAGVFVSQGEQVLANHYENYCQPMLAKLGTFAKSNDDSYIKSEILLKEDSYHPHHH